MANKVFVLLEISPLNGSSLPVSYYEKRKKRPRICVLLLIRPVVVLKTTHELGVVRVLDMTKRHPRTHLAS